MLITVNQLKHIFQGTILHRIFKCNMAYAVISQTDADLIKAQIELELNAHPHKLLIFAVTYKEHFYLIASNPREREHENFVEGFIADIQDDHSIFDDLKFRRINPEAIPIYFHFIMNSTTSEDIAATHIAHLAIAAAYRRQGLMKSVLLKIIRILAAQKGTGHIITAHPMATAAYLFFNPMEKITPDAALFFMPEEKTCREILIAHLKKQASSPTTFTDFFRTNLRCGFLNSDGIFPPSQTSTPLKPFG